VNNVVKSKVFAFALQISQFIKNQNIIEDMINDNIQNFFILLKNYFLFYYYFFKNFFLTLKNFFPQNFF
jgi:hypothetical protein